MEECERESRLSQDVSDRFESKLASVDNMFMTSQQIFNLMKDRMNDRKVSERRTDSPSSNWNVKSTSDHQDFDDANKRSSSYHSVDAAEHLTPKLEVGSNSGHQLSGYPQDSVLHPLYSSVYQFPHLSQTGNIDRDERHHAFYSQHVAAHETPSVGVEISSQSGQTWTLYDNPSVSSAHHMYQSQAADAGDVSYRVSLSDDVQWLDSWTSAAEDSDLRSYRRDY